MSSERRTAPRWRASSNQFKIQVWHEDGSHSEATIIDVAKAGIGLRADRQGFKTGMRARLELDLFGKRFEIQGVARFVDRFFPRVGLQVESLDLMEKVLQQAEMGGFMMTELKGDTLMVNGTVTLVGMSEFNPTRRYRKIDLSGVGAISVGAASLVSAVARKGAKIDCCSEPIAPLFDSLGICKGAELCVATAPCDLPKKWPTRRALADQAEP